MNKPTPDTTPLDSAVLAMVYALNSASPNEIRAALHRLNEIVADFGSAASVRRIAEKVRPILRAELKRS